MAVSLNVRVNYTYSTAQKHTAVRILVTYFNCSGCRCLLVTLFVNCFFKHFFNLISIIVKQTISFKQKYDVFFVTMHPNLNIRREYKVTGHSCVALFCRVNVVWRSVSLSQ